MDGGSGTVGEWYGVKKSLSPITWSSELLRSNLAVYPFSKELPWSPNLLYLNQIYLVERDEIDIEVLIVASRLDVKKRKNTL